MKRLKIGFSSLVRRVSGQTWNPAKDAGGYMLPVMAPVRKAEALNEGDAAMLTLSF